jgi:hypothetical protein
VVTTAFDAQVAFGNVDKELVIVGAALAALGILLWAKAFFGDGDDAIEGDAEQVSADLSQLPALLDLQEVRNPDFGDGDPLRVTLSALAKWHSRKAQTYENEKYYQAALERHFRRHASKLKCRREVWVGKERKDGIADLVLGNYVLIEVKRGFGKTTADRAIGQMFAYQQSWPNKPKLLVIFDANRDEVFKSAATPTLRALHEGADAVTVRM